MARYYTYDTETTGLKRHEGAYMFTFSDCDWNGNASVHRLWSHEGEHNPAAEKRLRWLWDDKGKTSVHKIMHNARFDVGMTEQHLGRSLYGHRVHETMALSHLFQNTHPTHGLDALGWELFGYPKSQDDPTAKYLNNERGLLDCPDWVLRPYQEADAERTMLIFRLWYPKLKEMGFQDEYDMECELVWTTKAIEERGMMLNRKRTIELRDECHRQEQQALEDFYALTRDRAKPTDGVLRYILYKKLKLPVIRKTKNAGLPSVNATTLKELEEKTQHPIFDIILRIRSYHKGMKNCENYLAHADGDYILHPSIHPYGADTGRETCKEPNLQNVAKETTMSARYPIRARRCFRPKPGYVNFHLDYKGIEFRRAVEHSGDEELIKMIANGDDPHSEAAAIFYCDRWRKAQDDPMKKKGMRDRSKNGNFLMMYGGAIPKLADTLGLPIKTTAPRFRAYKERFPGLGTLYERTVAAAKRDGYITTMFGRRLYVPKYHAALNYLIQGESASILKRAQNKVHRYLEDATGGEAGIILPIHDEIVIEWPRKRLKDAPACLRDIRDLMADFPQFSVPLEIDCERSTADWSRLTDVKIPA